MLQKVSIRTAMKQNWLDVREAIIEIHLRMQRANRTTCNPISLAVVLFQVRIRGGRLKERDKQNQAKCARTYATCVRHNAVWPQLRCDRATSSIGRHLLLRRENHISFKQVLIVHSTIFRTKKTYIIVFSACNNNKVQLNSTITEQVTTSVNVEAVLTNREAYRAAQLKTFCPWSWTKEKSSILFKTDTISLNNNKY